MTKKLILTLVTFFLTFSLTDAFLNYKFPAKCTIYQPDQILGHSLIPNKTCVEKNNEFNAEYKINKDGFRDNEISKEKKPQTTRILFLGDSFTQGTGVNLPETFVKKTEYLLNQNADSKHFETINAGVSAYTTLNEYLMLKNKGLELNPDLVILNINATDFIEQRALLKQVIKKNKGEISFAKLERRKYLPEPLDKFLINHSLIYNKFIANQENLVKLKGKLAAALAHQQSPDYTKSNSDFIPGDPDRDIFAVTRNIPQDELNDLISPVLDQLDDIKKVLDGNNIRLVVTYIPHGHQINPIQWVNGRAVAKLTDSSYPDNLQAKLKDYAVLKGISFLDITANLREFVSNYPDKKLYFDFDGHFNALGHLIAAESITQFLIDNQKSLLETSK